jgi:hypothetical protein
MMDSVKEEELVVPPLKFSPLPPGQGATPIVWPTELEYIEKGEYEAPQEFESISPTGDQKTMTQHIDVIVIHKKSSQRKYGRLRINLDKATPEDGLVEAAPVFTEILEDLGEDYPDFLFIY